MKQTINGKRYDTNKCDLLGEFDHHSDSGNYSGTSYLLHASDGAILVETCSNGQDLFLTDCLVLLSDSSYSIDDFTMTDDQEKKCAQYGLIEIVE